MNNENIMRNLSFEILKPHHDTSTFQSKHEELNSYLKNDALKAQESYDKVTHLVIYEEEIIGYFSLHVYFEGIPTNDYEQLKEDIPELPERNRLPLVEIEKFTMSEEYEIPEVIMSVYDNIVHNIKNIFSEYDFDGVSIAISNNCGIPMEN